VTTMSNTNNGDHAVRQRVRWEIDYDVHLGTVWGRFMTGLRARVVYGNRCPSCGRVFVPPQAFCEVCFVPTSDWVTLGDEGDLITYTVVQLGFRGGPVPPYAVGAVRMDGASTMLMHFVGGIDLADPSSVRQQLPDGRRLRIVWAAERTGSILDIAHFAPASP